MKYRILEIMPGQIRVEFEDSSWAIVPIKPDATPEDVDSAVSAYDKDYLPNPEDLINKNITLGEERTSTPMTTTTTSTDSDPVFAMSEGVVNKIDSAILSSNTIEVIDSILIGYFYAQKGDTRIKELIDKKIEDYIIGQSVTVDDVIFNINDDSEEIYKIAMYELESQTTTETTTDVPTESTSGVSTSTTLNSENTSLN